MIPWEVTATPRGVECNVCGKPSQYLTVAGRRCYPCAAAIDDQRFTARVDLSRQGPRTLIVYAKDRHIAHAVVADGGYMVQSVKRRVPVATAAEDNRKAPGA